MAERAGRTNKERVLAAYPNAVCRPDEYGEWVVYTTGVGISRKLNSPRGAWRDAASRLSTKGK